MISTPQTVFCRYVHMFHFSVPLCAFPVLRVLHQAKTHSAKMAGRPIYIAQTGSSADAESMSDAAQSAYTVQITVFALKRLSSQAQQTQRMTTLSSWLTLAAPR